MYQLKDVLPDAMDTKTTLCVLDIESAFNNISHTKIQNVLIPKGIRDIFSFSMSKEFIKQINGSTTRYQLNINVG